jgi:hypothetical protein
VRDNLDRRSKGNGKHPSYYTKGEGYIIGDSLYIVTIHNKSKQVSKKRAPKNVDETA